MDYDEPDDLPHDLVDTFSLNIPSGFGVYYIGFNARVESDGRGQYGLARITLRAKVRCAQFFYGDRCRYINVCAQDAIQCSGHGTCVREMNSYSCACNHGYTGRNCEEDIDECSLMETPCSGRGNCSDGMASFNCSCEPGYTGQVCETDVDECAGVTCNGRGNCTDRVNGFVCDCLPGYTGEECETDVNECEGQNCSGNGQCVDLVNRFLCDCDLGFTGTLCDSIDDCVGVNCSGNGQCVDGENNFTCLCQPGFTGDLCSVEIQGNIFFLHTCISYICILCVATTLMALTVVFLYTQLWVGK